MKLKEISSSFMLAINTNKENIIKILKNKFNKVTFFNITNKRITLEIENNIIFLENNEDFNYDLAINDVDAYLYFETLVYFYPTDNVKIEQQMELSKNLKNIFENNNFSCDIIAEFEPYL